MWELNYKESWAPKNWSFRIVVLEKTLQSPLDCKEIKPVNPKGNKCWIFIGRTDAEAPILWPPDPKSWLIGKDPDVGKDWRQEEKGITEDEMVGWHQWLNGHEFQQAWGVGDGQGSLMCYRPWGCKESDTTEWLSWTEGPTQWVLLQSDCVVFSEKIRTHWETWRAQEHGGRTLWRVRKCGHLQVKERGLKRNQTSQYHHLGFLDPRMTRTHHLCCSSHPICSILQPE